MKTDSAGISRAQGCLIGQLAGDALGSLVEFQLPEEILESYPDGVRIMADGGTWDTIAGQPTDDSEMALLLARMLVKTGTYEPGAARKEYLYWLNSGPFDCGMTISSSLQGSMNHYSQANGALMRISPLGIFGARHPLEQVASWAMADAEITHPNLVCQQVNALFAMGIAHAVSSGCDGETLYKNIYSWAASMQVEEIVMETIEQASFKLPDDFISQQGWVLIAFQNALYQLLHAQNLEASIADTISHGGDTDTNAAICGALAGAVWGLEAVPRQWLETLLSCRPEQGKQHVRHPRPACFWPVDALELSQQLLGIPLEGV